MAASTHVTGWWSRGLTFPLALLAFVAVGVEYFGSIFTVETRWAFLAVLIVGLVWRGQLHTALNARFGPILILYSFWCLLTSVWSSVPELSALKALATFVVTLTFIAGGRYWAIRPTSTPAIYYLAPVTVTALAAGFLGSREDAISNDSLLYGLTGNPNYLGILAAASFASIAFLTYRAFRARSNVNVRLVSIAIAIALAVVLWRTGSRAALLCAIIIATSAILALRLRKSVVIVALLGALTAGTFLAVPQVEDQFYTRFVIKYAEDGNLFESRREPWEQSWEGAQYGGWTGLGYGTSYGDEGFAGGLTAIGYGREKANSQMAVLEETGIVGGILYSLLIVLILRDLALGFRWAPDLDTRVEIALIIGLLLGLLAQSVFEAWWTSPGSMESSIFWASVGVGSGLARRIVAARSRQDLAHESFHSMQVSAAPRL